MSLKNFLDDVEHIPTISAIALKVLQKLANPEVNINELTQIIEQDQALSANILKVANSGYFEFMDEVCTVKKAVVLIGFKMTREITSAFAVKSLFESLKPIENFDYLHLWKHALLSALFAQKLAVRKNLPEDELYMSALLHDIGIVIQLFYDPQFYALIYNKSIENHGTYYEQEIKEQVELYHTEVGFMILQKWHIPVSIIIPVRWHHQFHKLDKNLVDYQQQIILIALSNLYQLNEEAREDFLHTNVDALQLQSLIEDFMDLYRDISDSIKEDEDYMNLFFQ